MPWPYHQKTKTKAIARMIMHCVISGIMGYTSVSFLMTHFGGHPILYALSGILGYGGVLTFEYILWRYTPWGCKDYFND